jgi:hypothetical protein
VSFSDAMEPLLDCMCESLALAGWEGDCCLVPGLPSFDTCTKTGGEAYIRLARAYPTQNFPREDRGTGMSQCMGTSVWALVLELGATHGICDDMCDCGKKAANADNVLRIAEAGLQGVICCLEQGPCIGTEYVVTNMALNPPFGGCGGFKIDLVIQYVMACCGEES